MVKKTTLKSLHFVELITQAQNERRKGKGKKMINQITSNEYMSSVQTLYNKFSCNRYRND